MSGVPSEKTSRHRDDRQGLLDLGLLPGADDAGHGVAVGKAERAKAEQLGRHRQLLGLEAPRRNEKFDCDGELGIGDGGRRVHAKMPVHEPARRCRGRRRKDLGEKASSGGRRHPRRGNSRASAPRSSCRATIPARCAQDLPRAATRWRARRQRNAGGPSGTSLADTSTGSGGANSRTGRTRPCRGSAGYLRGAGETGVCRGKRHRCFGERRQPHRTLRQMAGDRCRHAEQPRARAGHAPGRQTARAPRRHR